MYEYTKKLGQKHYAEDDSHLTLCGRTMLGNNYASVMLEADKTACEECAVVKEKMEKLDKEQEDALKEEEGTEKCTQMKFPFMKGFDKKKNKERLEEAKKHLSVEQQERAVNVIEVIKKSGVEHVILMGAMMGGQDPVSALTGTAATICTMIERNILTLNKEDQWVASKKEESTKI